MKRGAAPKFKELGSSPVKQDSKKTFERIQTQRQKGKEFVKNLKIKGPKRLPKNLVLGQSYEGFSDAEWAKFEKGHKAANKAEWARVGRVAGRALGVAGVGSIMYDFYKSGQKHSGGKAVKGQKSFMADARKKTKSIYNKK